MESKILKAAYHSIETEAEAVLNTADYLDEAAFLKAVKAIALAPLTVTSACGSSGIAAMKLAHSLCCIERPARFLPPAEAVHGGLGCVQPGDVVVLVSRGGGSSELTPIIPVVKKKGAILIAVTENLSSYLSQEADITLILNIKQESDKFNIMSTASFLSTIAVFDALICALIEETDFKIEQFALIHSGGMVGKRLSSKIYE